MLGFGNETEALDMFWVTSTSVLANADAMCSMDQSKWKEAVFAMDSMKLMEYQQIPLGRTKNY